MTTYTITGPDGKDYSIDGPAGQSQEQVVAKIQEHQKPVDRDAYYGKLSGMLDSLQRQLAPSWEHNKPGYSPYTPAQPGNMPNDAINPVGNDAQFAAAGSGAGIGRLAANIPQRPQPAPPQPPVNMNQMPTDSSFGAQMARNTGGAPQPVGGGTPIGGAGDALQAQLLNAAKQHGPAAIGHAVGGPIGGAIGHFAPKILGLMK